MDVVEANSLQLAEKFHNTQLEKQRQTLVDEYLIAVNSISTVDLTSLWQEIKWVNTKEIKLDDMMGKVVLLDFFTYCCINCMHMIPFLHKMESLYSVENGLFVIGVHSAKFPNEKEVNNIFKALLRYNIKHPVVNDSNLELWEKFMIKCWPTFVVINPFGKVILSLPGETHADVIEAVIRESVIFYKTEISKHSIEPSFESLEVCHDPANITLNQESNQLNFPGKIDIDSSGSRIAIADTGNHRVIVAFVDGTIQHSIGGPHPGKSDGKFTAARFNSPQGLAWHGTNSIYVADCNNHLIRKIDLLVYRVVTLTGNGKHSSDYEVGGNGTDQPICSPWDVQVAGSPGFPQNESILFIAMSGIHQIWAFFLQDADWQKGSEYKMGTCLRFAGNGQEENRNNSYPHKAGFAQPSGLTVDFQSHTLYVADSESSTVRKIKLNNGAVEGLVGGHFDPTNLFAYGDEDGKGRKAKLQHPLCVSWDKKRSLLYVADSYNHKIKAVDPFKKTCFTLCGPNKSTIAVTKEHNSPDEVSPGNLNEPGGICVDSQCEHLYIADTNNHKVKVLCLLDGNIETLNLESPKNKKITQEDKGLKTYSNVTSIVKRNAAQQLIMKPQTSAVNQPIKLCISTDEIHLTQNAPSAWQLTASLSSNDELDNAVFLIESGKFESASAEAEVSVQLSSLVGALVTQSDQHKPPPDSVDLNLKWEANLYYCVGDSRLCTMKSIVVTLPVTITSPVENCAIDTVVPIKLSLIPT
ncbi:NHL repeat-containing protein 2-like isoform X2 [Clavelina lepadiformis]|uniref:NHL repeat-containing protein 2-like isoform X2 n=1 Tax=Clavelina lepadiformis TaxID=159417 RepID=UPI004041D029